MPAITLARVRLARLTLPLLAVVSAVAACGTQHGAHLAPSAPLRSVSVVSGCLRSEQLAFRLVPATHPSVLYQPDAGPVEVLIVGREHALIWLYRSVAVARRFLNAAITDLAILGYGNAIVEFVGREQPTRAQERLIDACAFAGASGVLASPLIVTYS